MSATSAYLEGLIDECGGFSRFQWIMFSVLMYSRLASTWTMMMMTFAGARPDWQCRFTNYTNYDTTLQFNTNDTQYVDNQCYPPENTTTRNCLEYSFSNSMNTIVSEWTLICDKDWIASTITTIQMAGLLISYIVSGHLADFIGRKPTYFLSLALLIVLNIVTGFSTSWEFFAVLRFLLGFCLGANLTVLYNYFIEFIPAKTRGLTIAFPSWPIWTCVFGLTSMWLHDWKYLHFATSLLTLPCLSMWWFFPESFRYLVTHNRLDEAKAIVSKIARINGKPEPDMSKMSYFVKADLKVQANRKYTILDIINSQRLRQYTILLGIAWISCGYGYYAISFGVQSLSGSLYLNMFLLNVVDIPAQVSSYYLTNRFGRKWLTSGLLMVAAIAGFVVAALQISDLTMRNSLINGFALGAKMSCNVGWITLIILSTESYPTVVRNIGYGMLGALGKVGSLVAPQIVYLDNHIPGAMYFIFGGSMLLSAFCVYFVEETNKKPIEDGITEKKTKEEMQNIQIDSEI